MARQRAPMPDIKYTSWTVDDPTCTLEDDIWMFLDDDIETTETYHDDLLTLLVRRVLDRIVHKATTDPAGSIVSSSPPADVETSCFLCKNKDVADAEVHRAAWRKLVRKYLRFAASQLRQLYKQSEEYGGYISERWYLGNLVCQRCGVFTCGAYSSCPWYFGEAERNAQLQQTEQLAHAEAVARMKPCMCCTRPPPKKGKRANACSCSGCSNTPSLECVSGKCSPCCRDATCVCHHPLPRSMGVRNKFVFIWQ